ncbi:MAG: hypothetical protein J5526_03090 [Bacteroidales bacterium]|nr:hypothetical protein [Bacteroidales bacterium]
MQTAANYQDMSAVDALWTLYQQQSQRVRDAFRSRIANEDNDLQSLTEEEAKAMTLQRGSDIKAGRAKLIPHEAVMQEMEQVLESYAD